MWDTINSAWLELQSALGVAAPRHARNWRTSPRFVQETSLRFDGSAYRTMLRNDAHWFSRLGLHLERADNTAAHSGRQISSAAGPGRTNMSAARSTTIHGPRSWEASVSALDGLLPLGLSRDAKPRLIADLLILPTHTPPRSPASCHGNLVRNLDHRSACPMAVRGAAQRHARGVLSEPASNTANMQDIFQHGLHESIQESTEDTEKAVRATLLLNNISDLSLASRELICRFRDTTLPRWKPAYIGPIRPPIATSRRSFGRDPDSCG